MNLLLYVDEEIDESRGLEYLRRCSSPEIFHRVLAHMWAGLKEARKLHPRGELALYISFELVRQFKSNLRVVRAKVANAPPSLKQFQKEHFSTFLLIVDEQGQVIGVYKDILSLTG
jgi:hypothetical protein